MLVSKITVLPNRVLLLTSDEAAEVRIDNGDEFVRWLSTGKVTYQSEIGGGMDE